MGYNNTAITIGSPSRPTRHVEIEDVSKIKYYEDLGYKILSQSGWKEVTALVDGEFKKVSRCSLMMRYTK